jgi:SAM-dependent methyltransferase
MNETNFCVSELDKYFYSIIRNNVSQFLQGSAERYDRNGLLVLDIAPQVHEGARAYFKLARVESLDIDPNSNATHIADITKYNSFLKSDMFDIVICTEVLEHTLNPFSAIREIGRITKKSGILLLSVPFNFRIHGPLPDCWRFTEHGLRELLRDWSCTKIEAIDSKDRDLMPVHYTVTAIK